MHFSIQDRYLANNDIKCYVKISQIIKCLLSLFIVLSIANIKTIHILSLLFFQFIAYIFIYYKYGKSTFVITLAIYSLFYPLHWIIQHPNRDWYSPMNIINITIYFLAFLFVIYSTDWEKIDSVYDHTIVPYQQFKMALQCTIIVLFVIMILNMFCAVEKRESVIFDLGLFSLLSFEIIRMLL